MTDQIPTTSQLTSGTLEKSGVRYYLCENENPSDSIVLTLIVHVGSLMEDDSEQGLAHFIEHLGFKSTKSFEHYELVKFLESLGLSYGPDLNASTHLLETVFRLNIKFDEVLSQISMGINVLSEWAYHMTISEKDVVEERQVISAEYTAKQGLSNRLLKKYWAAIFGPSASSEDKNVNLLSKRFPIGIPEVFMNCNSEKIRQFYQKWYRPENMSVLVCGALHSRQQEIVDLLDHSFSLVNSTNPVGEMQLLPSLSSSTPVTRCQQLQDEYLTLPRFDQSDDIVVAMVDADLSCSQICFEFFSPVQKSKTHDFIRQDVIRRLMSSILDKRFNELHKSSGRVPRDAINAMRGDADISAGNCVESISPFLSVQISIREFVRGLVCIGVSATLKDISSNDRDASIDEVDEKTTDNANNENSAAEEEKGGLDIAVQSLLLEMKRLRYLGANQIELDNAKGKWLKFFTQQKNRNLVDNSYMMSELQNYVLNGESVPFASPPSEAQLCIDIIQSISLEEMNDFLRLTFDMDVGPRDSAHYYNQSTIDQSFRALSGQFQKPFPESMTEDQHLSSVLEKARTAVATMNTLETWPSHVHIDESVVLDFAQRALDQRGATDNPFIKEENYIESLDCSEIILSNGITVCCKWMPHESQDKVSMQAFSLGGSSELCPVADLLMSGLDEVAGHSTSTIHEVDVLNTDTASPTDSSLNGKDILELQSIAHSRVNTQRHQHHRGIGGSTTSDKLELLLAFLVIKMTSQRIDRVHFDDWIAKKKAQLKNPSNSPEFKFMNRSRVLACGDEPNFRPISLPLVEEASGCYDMMCDLYSKAFQADPTEFSFVFTGDIGNREHFLDLLVKYLGRLTPNNGVIQKHGRWLKGTVPATLHTNSDDGSNISSVVNNSPQSSHPFQLFNSSNMDINQPIEESMHLLNREDNKSSMMLVFRVDMRRFLDDDADLGYSMALDAACRVLQTYLLDELRINLGKVYNVNVEKSRSSLCTFYLISIGLHCQPSDVDEVKLAIRSIVLKLQSHGPEEANLTSVAESMCKTHKDASSNSSYWLFWILDSYKAFELHRWRQHQQLSNCEPSCRWLERNGWLRALGKVTHIKENLNCHILQRIYQDVFDLEKSILMTLMPELSADLHDIGGRIGEKTCDESSGNVPGSVRKTSLVEVSVEAS
mmetsp:Transcript_6231/g.10180  ORF Transcript_6231/g.10180 Transcript_6231/m.10180 type:complete len:1168 (+) Transcript_6231:46-3549(+)